ncbi:LuxR family transcriptional regulator [Erwinia sp. OLTSP20]|uniref:helix-turn-helix transcriptional regulator n=1 Tax=unclassified Erwinia TaxID=2622719 RepID=UPI000C1998FF|nr:MULTISPECIES: LuxR family transcriptional regulator [unclassified Erwinia]PIJ49780.1 LuxR family transcriptional regulator [Erwinia sp. OAMSP11]PIJ70879.1 LuxR family transcriptional regulator [Erwinia sp. OLSSP12]PIJ80244.1 LuxR family transcriptional regulator [Erwinia sp. OLCASP19]PIJ82368.1 LuxR family transcriptional regulator [Erwinia sp. OLMTSP26]PIJ85054.1 LuxR family transcriptional regulator [Erwinia sp. OLMDSP33]
MFAFFSANYTATNTLRNYIERKLQRYDSLEYAYIVVNKKNPADALIISNYPDKWVQLYRDNNFQLTDPVILFAFKRTSPFAWDENITLLSDMQFNKVFTLSRQYNIVNGFTFVLHDHMNNLALLSFIIRAAHRQELEQHLATEQAELQMQLINFNEQMYRLTGSIAQKEQVQIAGESNAIFTLRENEVLYWVSMGKTYAETAIISGISLSTVKFHVKNIVAKLGVSNVRQAIRLGVELDLIRPAPSATRTRL